MTTALDSVWWLGGSPCSGKSTLARRLADAIGAHLYSCDDAFNRHAEEARAEAGPTLKRVSSLSAAQRLAQPIQTQVDDVFNAYREQWQQILLEVRSLHGRVVVEGAALLPELLTAVPVAADHAVWIVPTGAFQRDHYARRAWARDLIRHDDQPGEAFERWMLRDERFADTVADQARHLSLTVIITDHGVSIDNQFAALCQHLTLPPPAHETETQ